MDCRPSAVAVGDGVVYIGNRGEDRQAASTARLAHQLRTAAPGFPL